ncbi:MAG: cation transporting ATPase C-terminal domain-containing protein [bacterium]
MFTFFTLYKLLQAPIHMFQTGWFLESILTQLCILFIIRTQKNFFKSRPKKNLIWFSVVALLVTLGIIYMPFSETLDMYHLPLSIIGSIAGIIILYVITADILKKYFFRRINKMS